MWGVFSGKKSDVSTRSSASRKKSTTGGSSSKSKRDSKSSRRSASGRTSTTRSVKDDSDSDSDDDDKPRDGSPVRASSERSSRSKRDRDSKRSSSKSSSKYRDPNNNNNNDDDDGKTAVSSVYYDANDQNASTVTPRSSTRYREPKDSRVSATPSRASARSRGVDEYQTTPSKYQDSRSSRDSTTPLRSSTKSRSIDAHDDMPLEYQKSQIPRDPITPSRSSTRTRGIDEYDSGPSKYRDTQDYTTPRSSASTRTKGIDEYDSGPSKYRDTQDYTTPRSSASTRTRGINEYDSGPSKYRETQNYTTPRPSTSTRGIDDYQAPSSLSSKYKPSLDSKSSNSRTRAADDNVSGTYAPQTSQYSTSQQTTSSQVYNSTTSQQKLSASYNSSDSPTTAQQKYDFQSTIPNQFPGQVPNEYSAPFRPPGSPTADFSYGAAASYYGDHGESVSFQPGVRPGTPMVVGTEPHLRPALLNSNPPSETGEGAAADYYNESVQVPNNPASQASSTTIKPTKQSSNSSYSQAMMTTAAATAAGGSYSTSQSYNTSTTPDKPPKFSAGQSNIPMVAAGLAGAVGLGAAAWKRKHDQRIHTTEQHSSSSSASVGARPRPNRHSSSTAHANRLSASTSGGLQQSQQTTTTTMDVDSKYDSRNNTYTREREQRGPLGRLADWWADYEDIRRMEEYTEYIGVCKYCFDPRSTARDAPRRHHFRRRPSREFRRDRIRVDKDSRYASESDSRRKSRRTGSNLGTAAALAGGVGLAAAARRGHREARRGLERLDGGQRRFGHRESESRRQRSDSLERRTSVSRGVVHRDSHGSLYMTREGDGRRVESSHRSRRSRSRSHSRSPSRRTGEAALLGAGAATITGIGMEEALKHRKKAGRSDDDIGVERRHSRMSSSSSSSESEVGFFASIFSPKSKKKTKEKAKTKRKESFYSQAVASSSSASSIDSHLAYGTLLRRSSRSKVRSRSPTKRQSLGKVSGKAGRVLPGMAAAAALVTAVEEVKRNQRKANSAKLVAVREKKIPDRQPASQRLTQGVTGAVEEGDWESANEDEYSSSNDSALAFGFDHQTRRLARKSHESLSSVSSGGDKWNWRWGSKKEKDKKRRKRRNSNSDTELKRIDSITPPPRPAADQTPSIPTDFTARQRRQSNASGRLSQAPMQYVDPMPVNESVVTDRYTESPRRVTTESVILQQPQPISPVKTSKYDAKIANGDYKASSSRRDSEDPAIYQRLKRVESLPIGDQDAPTAYGLQRHRTEPTMSGALRASDFTPRTESPREKRGSALRKVAGDVAIAGAIAGVGGLAYAATHQDSDENSKARRRSSSVRFAADDPKEELRRHRSRQSNFSEPLREESESVSPPRSRRSSKIDATEGPVPSVSKIRPYGNELPSVSEYTTQPHFDPPNQQFTSQPKFESISTAYAVPGSFEPPIAERDLPVNSEPTTTSYVAPSRDDDVSPSSVGKADVWDYRVKERESYTIPSETRIPDTIDKKEEVEQSTSDIPTFFTPAAAAMAMGPLVSELSKTEEPEKDDRYNEEQKVDAICSPPAVEADNTRSRATDEYHTRHYTGDARQSDEPIFDEDLNDRDFFKKKKKSKSERESRRQSRTAAELKNEFRNRSSSPAAQEERTAEEVFATFEDKYKDATVSQADFFKPADLDSDKKVIDDRVNADFDFEHQNGRSRSDSWVAKGLPWPVPRLNVVPATPPLSIAGSVNGDASRDVSPNRGSTTTAVQESEETVEPDTEQPPTTDIKPDSKADGFQDSHSAIQENISADREVDLASQIGSEVRTEPMPSTDSSTDSATAPGDVPKTTNDATTNGTKKKSKWASILGGFTTKPTQATSVHNAAEAFREAPFNKENDIISGYENDADEPEAPLQKGEPPSEEESTSMKSVVDAFDNARYSKENDIISGYGENGEGESLERQSTRTSQVSRSGKGEKSPSFTAALAAFGAGAAVSSASYLEKEKTPTSQGDVQESDPEPEAKQDSSRMPGGFGSDDEDMKSIDPTRSASSNANVVAHDLNQYPAPQSEISQNSASAIGITAEPSRDFSDSGHVPKSTYDITPDGEEQIQDKIGDLDSSKYVSPPTKEHFNDDDAILEKKSSEVSREYNSSNYVPARSTNDDSYDLLSRQSTRDVNSGDHHDSSYTNGKDVDTYSTSKLTQEDELRELDDNDQDYKYKPSRRPKSEPDYSDYATLSRSNSRASEPSSRRSQGRESKGKKSKSNSRRQSGHGEDFYSADIPDTASAVTAPPAVGADDFEPSGEKRKKRKSKRRSTQDGLDNDVEDDSISKVSTSRSEADLSRYARDEGARDRLKKELDLGSPDNDSILTTPQHPTESVSAMRAVLGSTPGPEDFQPAKLPSTASHADRRRSMEITSPTRPLLRQRSSMAVIDRPELWEVVPEMIRLPDSRPDSPYDEEQSVSRGALSPPPSTQPAPTRTPSSTAIPFYVLRRQPLSPGTPTSPSASGSTVNIPIPQRTRQHRPHSKEMKTTEFRPLYLVEANRKTPEPDVELPSLPSSRTTSRAASVHETDDDYESAFESPPRKRDRLPAFNFSFTPKRQSQQDEVDDLLDSQQTTPRAPTFSSDVFGDDKRSESPTAEESEESANSTKEEMPSIGGQRTVLSLATAGVGAGLGAAWLARELQDNVGHNETREMKDEPFLPLASKSIEHDEEADVDDSFHDVEEYRSSSEDNAQVAASVPIPTSDNEKDEEHELKYGTGSSPTEETTLEQEDIEKDDVVPAMSPPVREAAIETLESTDSTVDTKDQLATHFAQKDKEDSRTEESREIATPIEDDDQVVSFTDTSLAQNESAEMQQNEHGKGLIDPMDLTISPQTTVDESLTKGLLEPIELTSALQTSVKEVPDEWTSSSVAKKGKKSKGKGKDKGRKSKQEDTEGEVDVSQPELDLEPTREPEPERESESKPETEPELKPERESDPEPDRESDRAVINPSLDSAKADEIVESTEPVFETTADEWAKPSTDKKGKKGKRKKSKQLSFDDVDPVNSPAETFEPEVGFTETTASKITTAPPEAERTEEAVLELTEPIPDVSEEWATPASSKKGKKGKGKKSKQFVFEEDTLDKSRSESRELESRPDVSERDTATIPDKSEESTPAMLELTEPITDIREDWEMLSIGEEEPKSDEPKSEEPSLGDATPMEPYVEDSQLEIDAEDSTSRELERDLATMEEQVTKPVELTEPAVQLDETAWQSSTTKKGKKGKKKKTKELLVDDSESTLAISEAELPPARNDTSREPEAFTVQPVELTEPVNQPREDENERVVPVTGKKAKKDKGKKSRQSILENDIPLQTVTESLMPETVQTGDQDQILPIEREPEPEPKLDPISEPAIALSEEPKELVSEPLELTEMTSQNNDNDWSSFSNSKKGKKGKSKGKKSKQLSFDDETPASTAIEEFPKSDQSASGSETFQKPKEVDTQDQSVTPVESADQTDPKNEVAAPSSMEAEMEGKDETPSKSIIEDEEITSTITENDHKPHESDTEQQPAGEGKKLLSDSEPAEVADDIDAKNPIAQLDETTQPASVEDEWTIPSSVKKNKKGKGKKSKSVSFEDEVSTSTPTSSTPDSYELGVESVDEPLPIDSTAARESERYTDEPRGFTSQPFEDKSNKPAEEEWSIPTSSSGKKGKKGKNKKASMSNTLMLATGAALASGAALATSLYNSKNRNEEREPEQELGQELGHERECEHDFEAPADSQDKYESTTSTTGKEDRKREGKRDSQSYNPIEPDSLVERSLEYQETPEQEKHDSSTSKIDIPTAPEIELPVEQMDKPPVDDFEDGWNESLSSKKGKKKRKGKKSISEGTTEPGTSNLTEITNSESRSPSQFPIDLDDEDSKGQVAAVTTDPIDLQPVTQVQEGEPVILGPLEVAEDADLDPLSEAQQPESLTEKREQESDELSQEKVEQDSDWASVPVKTSGKKGKKGKGKKSSLLQELPDPSESSMPIPDIVETATLEPLAAERDERQLDSRLPALEVSGSTAPEEDEWAIAIQTGKKAKKGKKGKGKKVVSESDEDLQLVENLLKTTDTTGEEIETQEQVMTELRDDSEANIADTSKDIESAIVNPSIEQESDTFQHLTKDDTPELTSLSKKEKKTRKGKGKGKVLPITELVEPELESDVKAEVNPSFEQRPEEASEIAETIGTDFLVEFDSEMHDALKVPKSADVDSDTERTMQDAQESINTVDFEPVENSSFDEVDTTPEVKDNVSQEKAASGFSDPQNYAQDLSETVKTTNLEPLDESKVEEVNETPDVDSFADSKLSQQEEDVSQSDIVPDIVKTTELEPFVKETSQRSLDTETQSGAPDDEWAILTTSSKRKNKKSKKARSDFTEVRNIKLDDEAKDLSVPDEKSQVEELRQTAEMGYEQTEITVPEIAQSTVVETLAESGPELESKSGAELVQHQREDELNENDDWKSYISTGKKNKGQKGKRSKTTVTEELKDGEDSRLRDLATDIAESPSIEQSSQDPERLEHKQSTPDDWITTTAATSKKGKKNKGKGKKSKGQSFDFEPESKPELKGDSAEQMMKAVTDDNGPIEELHQDPEIFQAADSKTPVIPHETAEKIPEEIPGEIPEIVNETGLEPLQATDTGEEKEILEIPRTENPRELETNEELQKNSSEQRHEDEDDEWASTVTKKSKKSKGKKSRSQSSEIKNEFDKTDTLNIDASDVRGSEVLPEADQTIETPFEEALEADQPSDVNFAIPSGEVSSKQVSEADNDDWSLPSKQKGKSKGKKSKSQPTHSDLFPEERESKVTDVPEFVESTNAYSVPEVERSVELLEEDSSKATIQPSQIQTLSEDDQTSKNQVSEENEEWSVSAKQKNKKGKGKKYRSQSTDQSATTRGLPGIPTAVAAATAATAGLVAYEFGQRDNDDGNMGDNESPAAISTEKGDGGNASSKPDFLATEADEQSPLTTSEIENPNIEKHYEQEVTPEQLPLDNQSLEEPSRLEIANEQDEPSHYFLMDESPVKEDSWTPLSSKKKKKSKSKSQQSATSPLVSESQTPTDSNSETLESIDKRDDQIVRNSDESGNLNEKDVLERVAAESSIPVEDDEWAPTVTKKGKKAKGKAKNKVSRTDALDPEPERLTQSDGARSSQRSEGNNQSLDRPASQNLDQVRGADDRPANDHFGDNNAMEISSEEEQREIELSDNKSPQTNDAVNNLMGTQPMDDKTSYEETEPRETTDHLSHDRLLDSNIPGFNDTKTPDGNLSENDLAKTDPSSESGDWSSFSLKKNKKSGKGKGKKDRSQSLASNEVEPKSLIEPTQLQEHGKDLSCAAPTAEPEDIDTSLESDLKSQPGASAELREPEEEDIWAVITGKKHKKSQKKRQSVTFDDVLTIAGEEPSESATTESAARLESDITAQDDEWTGATSKTKKGKKKRQSSMLTGAIETNDKEEQFTPVRSEGRDIEAGGLSAEVEPRLEAELIDEPQPTVEDTEWAIQSSQKGKKAKKGKRQSMTSDKGLNVADDTSREETLIPSEDIKSDPDTQMVAGSRSMEDIQPSQPAADEEVINIPTTSRKNRKGKRNRQSLLLGDESETASNTAPVLPNETQSGSDLIEDTFPEKSEDNMKEQTESDATLQAEPETSLQAEPDIIAPTEPETTLQTESKTMLSNEFERESEAQPKQRVIDEGWPATTSTSASNKGRKNSKKRQSSGFGDVLEDTETGNSASSEIATQITEDRQIAPDKPIEAQPAATSYAESSSQHETEQPIEDEWSEKPKRKSKKNKKQRQSVNFEDDLDVPDKDIQETPADVALVQENENTQISDRILEESEAIAEPQPETQLVSQPVQRAEGEEWEDTSYKKRKGNKRRKSATIGALAAIFEIQDTTTSSRAKPSKLDREFSSKPLEVTDSPSVEQNPQDSAGDVLEDSAIIHAPQSEQTDNEKMVREESREEPGQRTSETLADEPRKFIEESQTTPMLTLDSPREETKIVEESVDFQRMDIDDQYKESISEETGNNSKGEDAIILEDTEIQPLAPATALNEPDSSHTLTDAPTTIEREDSAMNSAKLEPLDPENTLDDDEWTVPVATKKSKRKGKNKRQILDELEDITEDTNKPDSKELLTDAVEQNDSTPFRAKEDRLERLSFSAKDLSDSIAREGSTEFIDDSNDNDKISFQQAKSKKGKKGKRGKRVSSSDAFESESPKPESRDEKIEPSSSSFDAPVVEEPTAVEEPSSIRKESNQQKSERPSSQQDIGEPGDRKEEAGFLDNIQPTDELGLQDVIPVDDDSEFFTTKKSKKKGKRAKAAALGAAALGAIGLGMSKEKDKPVQVEDSTNNAKTASENSESPWSKPYKILESTNDGPRDLESNESAREIPLPSFDEDIESEGLTVSEITPKNEAMENRNHDQKHELREGSEVEIKEIDSTSTLPKHSFGSEEESRENSAYTQEYMQPLREAELIEHETTQEGDSSARRDFTGAEASPSHSQDDEKEQIQERTSIKDTWEDESATNDKDMHDRPSDSREQLSDIGQQILQEPHDVESPVHEDESFESLVAASLEESGFDPTLAQALSPDQKPALLESTEDDREDNNWTEFHSLRTQRRRHSISDSSNEDFGPAVHRDRAALSSDDESEIRYKRTDADFDEIVNSGLITAGFDAGTLEKALEVSREDGDNDLAHVIRRSPSPNAPSQLWSQASSSPAKGVSRQGSVEDVIESKGSSDISSSSSRRRRRDRRKGSAAAQAASVGLIGAGSMALESSQRKARRLGELPGDLRRQNTDDWERSLESTEEGKSETVPGRRTFNYSDGQDEPARQSINRDSGYQGSVPETPVFIQELEDIEEGHSSKPIDFFDPRVPMVNQTTMIEEDARSQIREAADEDYSLPSAPPEDEDGEDPSQVDPSSKVRTSYLFRGASSSPRDVRSSPAQARSQHHSPATGQALSQRELEERLSRSRSVSPDDSEEPMDTDSPSIQRQISRTRPLESIIERSPENSPVRRSTRMTVDEPLISDSFNSATSNVTRQVSAPAQTTSQSIIEEEDEEEEAVEPPKSITSSLLEQQERGEALPNRPEIANTRRAYMRSISSESNLARQEIRPPSALSARSNAQSPVQYPPPRTSSAQSFHSRTPSAMSNRSAGSSLRRTDRSTSDLRASNRRAEALTGDALAAAVVDKELKNKNNGSAERFQSYDPLKGSGKERRSDMSENNVYEGWGDVPDSPRSPSKPPSLRKRQSLHVLDLENRLEQMRQENQSLLDTHVKKQAEIEASVLEHQEANRSLTESLAARDFKMREKDVEIQTIRGSLELLQQEAARLTAVNEKLSEQNRGMSLSGEYATLQANHDKAQEQWRDSSRQLEDLQRKHTELNTGMEEEINRRLKDKDAEITELRAQLSRTTDKIRSLQGQLLATRRGDDYLNVRDEVYFDSACQQLCQHVQQWVLRFSKYSDTRVCRISADLHNEPLETRLDNAILDGTDVDIYLKNRVERRDVFMSVVMTMIWEFIFTRYLFGMDREQRQRLKALEKILSEVGPSKAVAQWRSITLSLLARRQAFTDQRAEDTEAVVQEIYSNLSQLLPPPSNVRQQIKDSLRNVLKLAVDLSIEMRTQRAEYIMCPPLKPEYDSNGDLARKVYFNASLMNERSGNFSSNDELESKQASVRLVLFPLVLKKGNEQGESDDELVVCPAQVLVSTPPKRRVSRVKSGPMSMAAENKSVQSVAPSVMDTDDNIV